jgi:hypothetical protein
MYHLNIWIFNFIIFNMKCGKYNVEHMLKIIEMIFIKCFTLIIQIVKYIY